MRKPLNYDIIIDQLKLCTDYAIAIKYDYSETLIRELIGCIEHVKAMLEKMVKSS